jgi:hypothetical protein
LLRKTPKLNEVEPNAYKIPRQVARHLATPWGEEVHSQDKDLAHLKTPDFSIDKNIFF